MSTGNIKLWWKVKKQPDSFNIYHSLAPFSATNLPSPVATGLDATARDFRHLDQEHQYDHYYRIASVKNGRLYVSKGILVRKKPWVLPEPITCDLATNYVAIAIPLSGDIDIPDSQFLAEYAQIISPEAYISVAKVLEDGSVLNDTETLTNSYFNVFTSTA